MSEQASEKAAKERLLVRLFYDWGLCFVLPPPVGSVSAVEARASNGCELSAFGMIAICR
jgi:hypothetical protein